ncbi:hypothetical protein ABL78_2265 [Leptomonas seymouri]|uniref:Uncharacterized protein n=1 Tax=Leptomonas seymouri TaxID=5684 RepID=A0A0N1I155_LEPSE|nr:hypothetical protein ABL78_2265 [Leptomonas seymouri]|eukprot:KPI88661.1 hypothetical protein ABL78_2265 [Leptomonas seymouri]
MPSNNNGDAPSGARDNISIAFTQSQYPTPYTDQTIPGSTPGHRLLHLGRQHQPADVLYNHLSHALIAHGDCSSLGVGSSMPWEGNADNPSPPGGNYILHSKNGGKRHYDELSGMFSERPWQPSKRVIEPLREDERRLVPSRRGRGVYNLADCLIHPDAEVAEQQRAQAEKRELEHFGRAHVCGPPDHTLAELGMWRPEQQQQQRKAATTAGARERGGASASPSTAVAAAPVDGAPTKKNTPKVETGPRVVSEAECRIENRAYYGQVLLPSVGAGVPPPRSTAAEADAVADYHRDQHMRCVLHLRKEGLTAAATRAADVQSVRALPDW